MPTILKATEPELQADHLASRALFACVVRELCEPIGTVERSGAQVVVRLPASGRRLRMEVVAGSLSIAPRFAGAVYELVGSKAAPLSVKSFAELVAEEMTAHSNIVNTEFVQQVLDGRDATTAILRAKNSVDLLSDPYLASEQSLVAGHPRHPTPKARPRPSDDWIEYAPEARTTFRLMLLAVRDSITLHEAAGDSKMSLFNKLNFAKIDGFVTLPIHPWQWNLFQNDAGLQSAIRAGDVRVLGYDTTKVVPTSSVRTVYFPADDTFLKLSLGVRLTNCYRKLAWYELKGAVWLTRLLGPMLADVERRYPSRFLMEPEALSIDLAHSDEVTRIQTLERFGVVAREGIDRHIPPGSTARLAGSFVEDDGLADLPTDPSKALDWWHRYVDLVMPPVLFAYSKYGIVTEPHLQNVILAVDDDGMPTKVIYRDLEGTKLVEGGATWNALAGLGEGLSTKLSYEPDRAWNRISYCLFVNNLAEMASAVGAACPAVASRLWPVVTRRHEAFVDVHGRWREMEKFAIETFMPAKANLLLRWSREGDCAADYVPVPNSLSRRYA